MADNHSAEGFSASNVPAEGLNVSDVPAEGVSMSNVPAEGSSNVPVGCSSMTNISGESSESTVQLNVKTLDSQIYSFSVDIKSKVLSLKEKIASEVRLPVGQQRLIFRGKVLKDDDLLSEYHVENGDTLHLVARQQPQPSAGASPEEGSGNNNAQGNDSNPAPRGRFGQLSHSVVLGTLNVGDHGEGTGSDLNRVIGAVLNSFGIGNPGSMGGMAGTQPSVLFAGPGQAPHGTETDDAHNNASGQSQEQGPSQTGQTTQGQPHPTLPQFMQIPLTGGAIPIPTINTPIPDSLNTVSEFMNRMQLALSQNGSEPNETGSPSDLPTVELPVNSLGLSTPGALSIVLRHAQRLLSDHILHALTHTAGRLDEEVAFTDLSVRGQLQADSMQLGLVIQHLGALFLELGRTIMTLRLGRSPAQSFVNAGPAVYISPRGPNPIMVQPFPFQTNSLFSGSSTASNLGVPGPVGVGNIPRQMNIHIHAGTPLAPIVSGAGLRVQNGDGMQGERDSGSSFGNSVTTGAQPLRNNVAGAIPLQQASFATSGVASQPSSLSGSQSTVQPTESSLMDPGSVRSLVNDINNMIQDQNQSSVQNSPSSPDVVDSLRTNTHNNLEEKTNMGSISGSKDASTEQEQSTPLGLGLGGLQPKKKKQPKLQSTDGAGSSNVNQMPTSSRGLRQGTIGSLDPGTIMSEVIQSPALDGLLAGLSHQTGMGSPDALKNMLQQVTQAPGMKNVFNEMAQQFDNQDSGMAAGQGGGMDLSRMIQQMMPIVSQALSGGSAHQEPHSGAEASQLQQSGRGLNNDNRRNDNYQVNLQQVAQSIQRHDPPRTIFRGMVENAIHLYGDGNSPPGLVDVLCDDANLADEFVEMLSHSLARRVGDEGGMA